MTKDEIQKNSEHWYNKYKDAEKRIEELEKENADQKDQLTKATEIIKRLKSLIEDVCDINYLSKNNTKLLEKAEQFLKEIEK